jgi:hypothetical protein
LRISVSRLALLRTENARRRWPRRGGELGSADLGTACQDLRGQPFGVAVLDVRRDGIAGITVFGDPALAERFA